MGPDYHAPLGPTPPPRHIPHSTLDQIRGILVSSLPPENLGPGQDDDDVDLLEEEEYPMPPPVAPARRVTFREPAQPAPSGPSAPTASSRASDQTPTDAGCHPEFRGFTQISRRRRGGQCWLTRTRPRESAAAVTSCLNYMRVF